jgi:hypothetical protein
MIIKKRNNIQLRIKIEWINLVLLLGENYAQKIVWLYMGELRSYCTVWRKKSKKIKVDLKEIWVVQSIELCQLCINIVFSQLSVFPFRKNSSFIIKCMFFMIFCHGKMYVFFQFLDKRNFTGVFIYWYYISIESSWKGESN